MRTGRGIGTPSSSKNSRTLRIIAGRHKKRKIPVPKGMKERPTTDRAKESLFNIIEGLSDLDGCDILDLFAGSGSISFEFCSRSQARVTAVEKDRKLCAVMEQSAADMDLEGLRIVNEDVLRFLDRCSDRFDLIFADPPYADPTLYEQVLERIQGKGILRKKGRLILEHDERKEFEGRAGHERTRSYGSSSFSFFHAAR
jgi:16S rRNA (guanine(966)-N(2))-methyltransferase RsmD